MTERAKLILGIHLLLIWVIAGFSFFDGWGGSYALAGWLFCMHSTYCWATGIPYSR